MRKFFNEFKQFALKGNALDLAVAVVIGGIFQSIINSMVNDLIMPLVGLVGRFDFSNLFIQLNNFDKQPATLADAQTMGVATFNYGNFITAVINFFIMAFVIFLMVKAMNKFKDAELLKKLGPAGDKEDKKEAPTKKQCPYCFSDIDIKATRCPHCTSLLTAEEKA